MSQLFEKKAYYYLTVIAEKNKGAEMRIIVAIIIMTLIMVIINRFWLIH